MEQSSSSILKRSITPNTLLQLLRTRAEEHPDRLVYRFIQDSESESITINYGELDRRARAIGAWLESFGAKGERAILLYPPGLDYIASFFGCLYAGVTAVPAYPPRLNRPVPRIRAMAADSQASFALATSTILSNIEQRFEHAPELAGLHWLNSDQVPAGIETDWHHPNISSETLAFLQYTSGSTSQPKGVKLTHGNLLHNLEAIRQGFQIDSSAIAVFWLPSYHDMGLIGGILEPMYLCAQSTLMSPISFLQRPFRWLEAINRFKATITGAPNFAYDLCVDRITPEQIETLDLSSMSLAFCGAEPIRPETLDRFARTFAGRGFRKSAFYPCFGMAEGTLIVSGGEGPAEPRTLTIDRKSLERDRVVESSPDDANSLTIVNCGKSIIDQKIEIVNPTTLNRCDENEVGEVWVTGPSVAQGYWGLEEESKHTFRAYLSDTVEGPFLRTGDLGFLQNGELFITGRLKDLIIIHGSNHYPQEIELTVESSHVALQPGAGAAFSVNENGKEQLVIVQEITRKNRQPDVNEVTSAIRQAVSEKHDLQVFAIVLIKPMSISKTSSGKIQRRACKTAFLDGELEVVGEWRSNSLSPRETAKRRVRGNLPTTVNKPNFESKQKSSSQIQSWLITRIASILEMDSSSIDPSQPFTYYGLGSVQAVSLTGDLEVFLNRKLAPTLAWDYPTIESLANFLAKESQPAKTATLTIASPQPTFNTLNEPIAIIGLSCRFPQADSPQAFWKLLRNGVDAITEVPSNRWDVDAFHSTEPSPGKVTTRFGGFLDNVDLFEPQFFGISPREADRMDPQQRLLLEVSWEALENAFIPHQSLAGTRTGVFVGISSYDYSRLQFDDPERIDAYSGTGNAHSIAANRLSYVFDLHGPSMAVDTACSSSLVSVHLACQSLRSRESDLALAGGVNLILTPELTITFSQARMLSPDGRCKTFDANADGYVRGEGCGVIILKRYSDALCDGDNILALIRGSAVNQDGRSNGLTAPNGLAQQDVIRQALSQAQVTPNQISYVEAHGTGTPLGDPIEMASLRAVLADDSNQRVLVGSVKTNIGHLESAAGIAGLVKVVLAMQNEAIPPHLHLKEINPYLSIDDSRLEVGTYLRPWKRREQPRFAGVSSFGFGGTNAHVILSDAPLAVMKTASQDIERPRHLVTLSAKTENALHELSQSISDALRSSQYVLPDFAFTTNTSRSHFEYRLAIQASNNEELIQSLNAFLTNTESPFLSLGKAMLGAQQKIAFLFTGQGSQYVGMGKQLYETQPVFRDALDECAKTLDSILDRPLLEIIFSSTKNDSTIHQTTHTQPALFAFEYALAQIWRSWGIEPHAVLGHSVGEYVAACIAGVFSLEDGLRLVAERARLIGTLNQDGTMAAVFIDAPRIAAVLKPYQDKVSIAAKNGSDNTVISGEKSAVQRVVDELTELGISSRLLTVSHAFHSPLMDSILDEFESLAQRIQFSMPHLPLISNVTGEILNQIPDATYWRNHIRAEVMFAAGMQSLSNLGIDIFIEIGPVPVLLGMGRRCLPESKASWLPSMRQNQDEWQVILNSLGKLYVQGVDVNWKNFDAGYSRNKVPLPNYPFERQRYWLDAFPKKPSTIKTDIPLSPSAISNGKSHVEHEELIASGNGKVKTETLRPQKLRTKSDADELNHAKLLTTEPAKRQKILEDFLQRQAARVLGMDPAHLSISQPLDTMGLDSLMAIEIKNSLESKLGIQLPVSSLLQGPTVTGLAAQILDHLDEPVSSVTMIPSQAIEGFHPLTHNQQAMWLLDQLMPEGVSFNVSGAVRLLGTLDRDAFRRAFTGLMARHAVLRTTFKVVDGEPMQRVHLQLPLPLEEIGAAIWTEEVLQSQLEEYAFRSFDLENEPAFRVVLFHRSAEEIVALLAVHHIITDFWSMTLLVSELMTLYATEKNGLDSTLPHLNHSYIDFAHWRNETLAGADGERYWEYWKEQLSGELPSLNLPADRPRKPIQIYRGETQHLHINAELTQRLKELAATNSATLYMTLLAAFQTLLFRYSGQADILIGSAMAGRTHPDLAGIMGYFVNPVAIRADFSNDPSFITFLEQIRKKVLNALDHQDFPPALIAERLGIIHRDASRPPLFETTFIYEKTHVENVRDINSLALGIPGVRIEFDDLTLESMSLLRQPSQFDLTLMMAETGDSLSASFIYNPDLFDASTITRFAEHFQNLLDGISASSDRPLSTIPILSTAERILFDQLNATDADYPRDLCLHQLLEEQAALTPDSVAVVFYDQQWTYRELNNRADSIAAVLRKQGVKPETLVGLCVDRSLHMLAALLGIHKAGSAYVPLDPTFPLERLAFMLADSAAPVLITQSSLASLFPEYSGKVVLLDEVAESFSKNKKRVTRKQDKQIPDNLAYVLYTSGSTGKPKGVMIPHRALVNFLVSMQKQPGLTANDTLLAVTTLSFDIAGLELFLPLVTGAKVVIADRETSYDPHLLMREMERCNATVMQATPATWRMLIDAGWKGKENLKILCGGEALPNDLADQLLACGSELWNLYGPTETTIWSTAYHVETSRRDGSGGVSIGKPIANTQIYILDANLQPTPIGVIGDLYIGGDGLSRGYLNRPELTAEKFNPNPFLPHLHSRSKGEGIRLYKTGDLARWLSDGTIEFLGRSDQQVKVRGYRIETAEIEAALAEHPSVQQVVVVARKDNASEAGLVAYVVPAEGEKARVEPGRNEADSKQWREFLRTKLPEYMIPSAFATLKSLPMTPNGKVDRKALSALPRESLVIRGTYVPPRTQLEKELAEVCSQVLGLEVEQVGVNDNFFDLGGHSLLGTRLVFILREKYGLENAQLPLRALFEQSTVANLAVVIKKALHGGKVTYVGQKNFIRINQLSLDELNSEAQLDANITTGHLVYEHVSKPHHILLTGATGFVGAFLLHDLLKKTSAEIHCLLRADDIKKGLGRLIQNLISYSLWDESFEHRIRPVLGDLGLPQLGLSDEMFDELANHIDWIYHNGAMVNFVYPYMAHKASNVIGTQEILRLASRMKLKPVHHISTLSILYSGGVNDGRVLYEDANLDVVGAPFGGYAQSKWVAEKLILQAISRGIPCAIYRPGLVSGHSITGAWNTDNLISSMTRACLLLKRLPSLDMMVNIVPVDFVSSATIHLSQNPENFGKVFHLNNPEPIHFSRLKDWLVTQGFEAGLLSFNEWRVELFRRVASMASDGWESYLPLIEEVEESQVFMPYFDLSNTLAGLNQSGIKCHPVNNQLFSTYTEYFVPQGFSFKPAVKNS